MKKLLLIPALLTASLAFSLQGISFDSFSRNIKKYGTKENVRNIGSAGAASFKAGVAKHGEIKEKARLKKAGKEEGLSKKEASDTESTDTNSATDSATE